MVGACLAFRGVAVECMFGKEAPLSCRESLSCLPGLLGAWVLHGGVGGTRMLAAPACWLRIGCPPPPAASCTTDASEQGLALWP